MTPRRLRLSWSNVSTSDIPPDLLRLDNDGSDNQRHRRRSLGDDDDESLKLHFVQTASQHVPQPKSTAAMPGLLDLRVSPANEAVADAPAAADHQRSHAQAHTPARGSGKLRKTNRKQVNSSDRARQVRDCIVCGLEPSPKLKTKLAHPEKANAIISKLRRVQVEYEQSEPQPQPKPGTSQLQQQQQQPRRPPLTHMKPRAFCLSKPFPTSESLSEQANAAQATSNDEPHEQHEEEGANARPTPQENSFVDIFSTKCAITPEGYIIGALTDHAAVALDALGGVAAAVLSNSQLILPHDRITVVSSWWGYEIAIPSASMHYLGQAKSISSTVFTFLQALATVGGMPELLPFIRYASAYTQFQFSAMQQQDQGHGVVLAATWVMPVALVPRPWDFSFEPLHNSENQGIKLRVSHVPLMLPTGAPNLSRVGERTEGTPAYLMSHPPLKDPSRPSARPTHEEESRDDSFGHDSTFDWRQASYQGVPSTLFQSPGHDFGETSRRQRAASASSTRSPSLLHQDSPPNAAVMERRPSRTPAELVPQWASSPVAAAQSDSQSLDRQRARSNSSNGTSSSSSYSIIGEAEYSRHTQPGSTPPLL